MSLQPYEIEKKSFEIIFNELAPCYRENPFLDLISRVIHTTADFEYAQLLEFINKPAEAFERALHKGLTIYADTTMIVSGINKRLLSQRGGSIISYIGDPSVAEEAKARGVTRSIVGIERAVREQSSSLFVIGNAPTALVRLHELMNEEKAFPELIIGVPVGFVGAAESKELIAGGNVPCIITKGRKGGSTVAAALVNALLYRTASYEER